MNETSLSFADMVGEGAVIFTNGNGVRIAAYFTDDVDTCQVHRWDDPSLPPITPECERKTGGKCNRGVNRHKLCATHEMQHWRTGDPRPQKFVKEERWYLESLWEDQHNEEKHPLSKSGALIMKHQKRKGIIHVDR